MLIRSLPERVSDLEAKYAASKKESLSNAMGQNTGFGGASKITGTNSFDDNTLTASLGGGSNPSNNTNNQQAIPPTESDVLFLLGILSQGGSLASDELSMLVKTFQESNHAVKAAAQANNITNTKITLVIDETVSLASKVKLIGRTFVVAGVAISFTEGSLGVLEGDYNKANKAALDIGVGLGAASIGGIPGVLTYSSYLLLFAPPPGFGGGFENSFDVNDNTFVTPILIK